MKHLDSTTLRTAPVAQRSAASSWRLFWLCCLFVLGVASSANATHFRYGSITWRTVQTDATNRTVEFKVSQSWRRTFYGAPTVGSTVNTGVLQFGDGGSASTVLVVTSVDLAADNFYGEAIIRHTYPAVGNYTAFFTGNARISTLVNNRDQSWYVSTVVNSGSGNNSPVSTLPPVVNLATNQAAASFQLPANDPDGHTLSYSLATPSDLPGVSFVNAPGLLVNATTGQVTFNTVGKAVGNLYNGIIKVSDGRTHIMVDFILQVTRSSVPPVFDYSQTPSNGFVYQLAPGQALTFNVRATDSDAGDVVRLQGIGLPPGSSMVPSLPVSGNPVASTFSWTPTLSTLGTSVINFVAQDLVGVQTTTSVTIQVSTKPVFDVPPTASNGSVFHVVPGSLISQPIQASNPDPANTVRIVNVSGLPAGAAFSPALPSPAANPTRTQLNWTPQVADWGLNTAVFTARNSTNDESQHTLKYIVNSAPSFLSAPSPASLTVVAGQLFRYDIVMTDPDLPYGDELEVETPGLPSWLTLVDNHDGTGTLSGTPSIANAGNHPVTLVAADIYHHGPSYGLITQSFVINVVPCNTQLSATGTNVSCNGKSDGSVQLAVSGGTAPFSYSWSGPNGYTSSVQNPGGLAAGTYTVTVTDANNCQETTQATLTEPVLEMPQISCSSNLSVGNDAGACGAVVAYTVPQGTHSCRNVTTTLTSGLPSGTQFPLGTTTVAYTVSDDAGNSASCSFTVTVTDAEAPTITAPVSLVVGTDATRCSASNVDLGQPVFGDNCTGATVANDAPVVFALGTTTVTWTVTDGAGLTATATQLVTVNDLTAPTVATRNVTVTLVNGAATVSAAQVDNGSADACGLRSLVLSRTTFTCANLGANAVTLTATDVHGNVASAPATVTVVGAIPTPSIAVTPSNSVYTGGVPTTLYLGYGPASATLTASGGVSYAWSPAAGLSSAIVANPVFTPTAPGAYTFTVTATNQFGCTATASVTITVVDVRCGNKNDKVLVCHNGHEICISPNAVPAHLSGHASDKLGSCPPAAARSVATATGGSANELAVYPNPTADQATVSFRSASNGNGQVTVYNTLGQRVASLYEGTVNGGQAYTFTLNGQNLATGLYECRLTINGKTESMRLVIAR